MNWFSIIAPALAATALLCAGGYRYLRCKKKRISSDNNPTPLTARDYELKRKISQFIQFDRFELVVQPVIDIRMRKIIGGEVLSRLNHPTYGTILPNIFLKAVDKMGLYPKFDIYIFGKSCQWLSHMISEEVPLQFLSCNFSRKTLSEKGLAEKLKEIAEEFSLNCTQIAIEITEQEAETDTTQFQANLRKLNQYGFQIFVDDLGNGVTSVKDLWSYPVDVVKIDRSLLLAAQTARGEATFRGLVKLASNTGAKILCEGIETEEQYQFAKNSGCHYAQGFLFSPPIPDDMFTILDKKRDCDPIPLYFTRLKLFKK